MVDPVVNKGKVTVSTGYNSTATSIVLATGQGAELPDPVVDGAYNLPWWDSTNYNDPADDPNFEIVRVTGPSGTGDTKTIVRAQEGTAATNKNNADATYKMHLGVTAKTITDLIADVEKCATVIVGKSGHVDYLTTDYGSDDACIQAAIDYVNGISGGSVLIREGNYSIEYQITLKNDVSVIGVKGTVLSFAIPTIDDDPIFYAQKLSNVEIRNIEFNDESGTYAKGHGAIWITYSGADPDNTANWGDNVLVDNCRVISTELTTTNWHFGLQIHCTKNAQVNNIYVYGVDYGVEFERCYFSTLTNSFIDTLDYGVVPGTSLQKRCIITNNHFDIGGTGVRVDGGENIIVSNNTITNSRTGTSAGYGAIVLSNSGSSETHHTVITGNTIYDCRRGIETLSDSGTILMTNNMISDCLYGINLAGADSPYNTEIIIDSNYIHTTYYPNIWIFANSKNIIISNNIIETPDDSVGDGVQTMIEIREETENINITGNLFKGVIKRTSLPAAIRKANETVTNNLSITDNIFNIVSGYDSVAVYPYYIRYTTYLINGFIFSNNIISKFIPTSDTDYGINDIVIKGTTDGTVRGNVLKDSVSIVNDSSNSNMVITENLGYNPVGSVGPPSVPATTVNYTNAYGYPCQVQVYGGTVTEIDIDDIATGLTSGIFMIPPGGTINITYSAAPSWRWWGL